MKDLRDYAVAERADLLTLLEQLSGAQWEAPSLCSGWRVRDVVAHVYSYDQLSRADLGRRFVRAGSIQPESTTPASLRTPSRRPPS